jgi:murein DD-endopeptidase MepM/ murein hydrolase activator NlpD
MRKILRLVVLAVFVTALVPAGGSRAATSGTWTWPVAGPIIRGFDPPASPFGSGHRGIDIAVALDTPIIAPAPGTVTFAGKVGGQLFVTIDHGAGLESTYSWVGSLAVRKNDVVTAGMTIASSGAGHPGGTIASLHLGVKLHDAYVDPLAYLGPVSVSGFIRLAPLA